LLDALLFLSYELERHSRNLFLNQRQALLASAAAAKFQLEIANRDLDAKRAMVRHISHEIRTPLNITAVGMDTISRALQKMPQTKMTSFLLETVDSCKIACEDALTIVSELLDFEKLAAGMFALETIPTRLAPWVEDCVKLFRVSAESKGLTIDFARPPGDGCDRCVAAIDPLKMSTVMRNLLSNAIKFSRPGGTIYVRLAVLGAEARRQSVAVARSQSIAPAPVSMRVSTGVMKKYDVVEISVQDDGAGLSKENIGRLFQEGVQINPNKLQKGGGSGFGLFITKGIVKLHGGSIWAESEGEGHGTTFAVQLPLCTEPPSPSVDGGTVLDHLDDVESMHSSHRDTHSAAGAFQVPWYYTLHLCFSAYSILSLSLPP